MDFMTFWLSALNIVYVIIGPCLQYYGYKRLFYRNLCLPSFRFPHPVWLMSIIYPSIKGTYVV